MKRVVLFWLALPCLLVAQAQNIKSDDVEYRYIKLPLTPLPASIKNYQSGIVAAYEAENQRKQAQYEAELAAAEAEYQQEMQAYPAKVKEAEDKYAREMEEWDKKSFGEKFLEKEVLKENNKPVKQIPSAPYKRSVSPPQLKTVYNHSALAGTYLVLDGFENKDDHAVKIEVTLNGFDYTQPIQITEQKNVIKVVNGTSTTSQEPTYRVEFTYRHAMSVKATGPDGKELFNLTPQELNTYKTYKSAQSSNPIPLNPEQLAKMHEEKILQDNLTLINNLVNDKIGFKREPRKTELAYVKAKDETIYADLLLAFNEAHSALKSLVDDQEAAQTKLKHAAEIWNGALKESDPANKKARINEAVTTMIHFNLLETYFALRDVPSAEKTIAALNTLDLSNGERKRKEQYEALVSDLKKRVAANK